MAWRTSIYVINDTTQTFNGLVFLFNGEVYNIIRDISAQVLRIGGGSTPWPPPPDKGPTNTNPPNSYLKFGGKPQTYMNVAPGDIVAVQYSYPNNCLYPIKGREAWMLNGNPKVRATISSCCWQTFEAELGDPISEFDEDDLT